MSAWYLTVSDEEFNRRCGDLCKQELRWLLIRMQSDASARVKDSRLYGILARRVSRTREIKNYE
jgi:hypothetical protein